MSRLSFSSLREVLLAKPDSRSATIKHDARKPPPTPELTRFNPLQRYRFTQTARAAVDISSLLVVLTFSGGGTRAAAETLLAESASFQQLLRDLRARPRPGKIAPWAG